MRAQRCVGTGMLISRQTRYITDGSTAAAAAALKLPGLVSVPSTQLNLLIAYIITRTEPRGVLQSYVLYFKLILLITTRYVLIPGTINIDNYSCTTFDTRHYKYWCKMM